MPTPTLITDSDPVRSALAQIRRSMEAAVAARGRFLMVLSGGSTPLPLYRLLARQVDLPWSRSQLFLADERFVPPDHQDSNRRTVEEALLAGLPPGKEPQFHPWPVLTTPQASARAYAQLVTEIAGDPPVFDLTLLGLGTDCHTASLFPGTGTSGAAGVTVASAPSGVSQERLSLTAAALSSSGTVLFLVRGEEKRGALLRLLTLTGGEDARDECPARAIGARERLLVITDLNVADGRAQQLE